MPEFREVPPDVNDDPADDYPNGYEPHEEVPGWEAIVNAPDYASLIASRQSRRGKQYEQKTNSVLKAAAFTCINAGDFKDAAAIFHYGPPFSYATGQFADSNETARRVIDLVTSPESPAVMFAITALTLTTQLLRNHEETIKQMPVKGREARRRRKAMSTARQAEPPRFSIGVGRWKIPIRFRARIKWSNITGLFRVQTQDPEDLMYRVFTDDSVMAALKKQGFTIKQNDQQPTA